MVQFRKREVVSGAGGEVARASRDRIWGVAGADNTVISTELSELPTALTPYAYYIAIRYQRKLDNISKAIVGINASSLKLTKYYSLPVGGQRPKVDI